MEENTPASSSSSPLENALRQIQGWFVSGDFVKVKQGCEEILKIAPNNSIAQDLLKKAEEALAKMQTSPAGSTPPNVAASAATPPPMTIPTPPLAATAPELHGTENTIPLAGGPTPDPYDLGIPMMNQESSKMPIPDTLHTPVDEDDHHKTHSLIVNLVILLAILCLGIGGIYAYKTFFGKEEAPENQSPVTNEEAEETEQPLEEEIPEETSEEPETEPETNSEAEEAEQRNEQRLTDLTEIEAGLIEFYDQYKRYPDAEEVNTILIENDFLETMPAAPLEGEVYMYAVYDTNLGPAQTYVLSAEFENEDGTKEIWSTGGNTIEYTDFRDLSQTNVTVVHPTLTEEEYLETDSESPEEIPEEEEEPKPRVPRT